MSAINGFSASFPHPGVDDRKRLERGGQAGPHAGKTCCLGDERAGQGNRVQDDHGKMTPPVNLELRPDVVKIEVNSRTVDHYQYNKVTVGDQSFEYNATNVELVSIRKETYGNFAYAEKPSQEQLIGYGSYSTQTYIDLENGTITRTSSLAAVQRYDNAETGGYWKKTLVGSTLCVSFSGVTYVPGRLGGTLEEMAAEYEAIRKGISVQYFGKDQEARTARLRELFGQGVEEAASSFADRIGSFLDKTGRVQQREKVYQSVRALAVSYEAKYRSIMERNSGRRDIREALANHDIKSLTAILRQLSASYTPEGKKDDGRQKDLYSLQELEYAAISVSACQVSINAIRENGCGSEARQALNVSMFSMKMEVLSARAGIGSEMKDVVRSMQDGARERMMDAMDEYLAHRREDPDGGPARGAEGQPVRRDIFSTVYNTVMNAFRMTGNAPEAIRAGASRAKPMLSETMERGAPAERWENEMKPRGYWDSFFSRTPYRAGGYQEYVNQWNAFLYEIGGEKEIRSKA